MYYCNKKYKLSIKGFFFCKLKDVCHKLDNAMLYFNVRSGLTQSCVCFTWPVTDMEMLSATTKEKEVISMSPEFSY